MEKDIYPADIIEQHMNKAKGARDYKRWRALYLYKVKGVTGKKVGQMLGYSRNQVCMIAKAFRDEGPEGLSFKNWGGRRREYMTLEKEKEFMESLHKQAIEGTFVTAREIKQGAEKLIGKKVSKDYAYDLLQRHSWAKQQPRPKHPKSDSEKQKDFKKNFLI